MSKLIIGTVQLGMQYGINNTSGKPSQEAAHHILTLAHQNKLEYIDTAFEYGEAQDIILNYQEKYKVNFKIITKVTDRIDSITLKNFAYSLPDNQIDVCLLHRASDLKTSIFENLYRLQQEGYVSKIGVSIYSNEELNQAIEHPQVQIIQLPYNLLDNFAQKGSLLQKAKEKGKILHTRSVFLQGLFFKELTQLPTNLSLLQPYLAEIRVIASEFDLTLAEIALNYVYHNPYIDGVLVGIETMEQLQTNVSSVHPDFSEEIIERINQIRVTETKLLNPSNW